ncbi:tetratricopeptide repeat protein [Waterburya agarophytonicola K14]|uniref:Tetratricopeptide repeat protein n=1 Tax=Waterburya agarophytonicola KI4 TaxID=2874699 RepID=A0A964BPA4_9CYAN|nr:tetratricopeptide repeat protein [Waterburya agarophytonicola]MCC0175415.1 tetratricopeptide repeat protein [Waterburya agarophytonicola KI4]
MSRGASSIKSVKSHLVKGEWEQVIKICQQEISLDPSAVDFYLYLAKAYVGQGNINAAISSYQKTLGTTIEQSEVYAELGLLWSKQKKLDRAVWHYQQALALRPDWAELQYNLGVVLHQSNDWNAAIIAYNQAIEIKPDYGAAYFNLGVLYDQKGELEIAIASYEQVIVVQPNFVRAYSNLGSTYARQKEYDLAIAIFQKGIHLDPTWATLHNNLGQVYWLNNEPGLAISSFENAIVLEPKMALAHHNLGKLWQQQGNYPQAIECYRRVIALEPANILAYSHCSDAEQKLGNLPAVLDLWRKIIKIQPDFVTVYCQRLLASEPDDLLAIAKKSCARFLQALLDEKDKIAYHYLGQTYEEMGDVLFEFRGLTQAEIYYQKALQLHPEKADLYLKLGNCLAKQQRWDGAIAIYQTGLNLQPKYPQICFQLGKILEQTQDAEQAIDCYESVLNQKMQNPQQWENLPRLFAREHNLSLLPEQVYHHTQDWVRDCQLEDFDYVQIVWSDVSPPINTIRGIRQPEALNILPPGKTAYSDCGGVNCNSCMTKLMEHFKPLQIGKNAYQCSLEQPAPIQSRLPFVVTIPQGRSWIAPQKNSWIICDALAVITPDNYLLGDLSRYYPWFLPECPYQERNEHSIFELESIPPVEKIDGKVALLSGLAGHVYYHWMFDILPRIELIQRSQIELKDIDCFVVNSLSKPYQKETLELLNIPSYKILESDRHCHIQAEELIVPSFPGYMDWIPPGTMEFLRQTFIPLVNLTEINIGKKIYISRAKSKNRQIINESEVDRLLTERGFETVFLEEMSVLEQVAIFVNAEVIVAPHGSGLTNLVFCSPHTQVVELFSPNYQRTDYWTISQHLQLQHYYLVGENFECLPLRNLMYQNSLTEDILVNIASLELILERILRDGNARS